MASITNNTLFNLEAVHCPRCRERMPFLRIPVDIHQLLWGGWTCPKCRCRMDQWGQAVEPGMPARPPQD